MSKQEPRKETIAGRELTLSPIPFKGLRRLMGTLPAIAKSGEMPVGDAADAISEWVRQSAAIEHREFESADTWDAFLGHGDDPMQTLAQLMLALPTVMAVSGLKMKEPDAGESAGEAAPSSTGTGSTST